VLGFCLMVWFIALVIRGGTRDSLRRSPHIGAVVQLGVVSGIVGLLVHSFVDFNLQIPANAATFYVFSSVAALRRR
jgi:hypothetical protein